MTENTDKSPQKSGKTPPSKRAGKTRSPEGKRAKAPGDKAPAASETEVPKPGVSRAPDAKAQESAADPATPGAKSLAPDPATITFGSNRPIVATPPKLPESSGLQFAGPSAGMLKASGPQPTSAKASGLTFTSGKPVTPSAKPAGGGTRPLPAKALAAKPLPAKPASKDGDAAAKDAAKQSTEAAKPADAKQSVGTAPEAKKAAGTKPAIAPQASSRHFDKERSTGGFVVMMLALIVVGGGMAFWMNFDNEAATPQQAPAVQQAEVETVPEIVPDAGRETDAVVILGPSVRAPESPGPLVAGPDAEAGLDVAQIGEIQQLLDRLGLNPGTQSGVLTAGTTAAIRSYQEMAGLTADGEVNEALLEELRSVVELYGS
ncbi:MAG: peptidoglycan-binding protein [Kiloniellaceae bacterium]